MMRFSRILSLVTFVLVQTFGSASYSANASASGLSEMPPYFSDLGHPQQTGQINLQHILMLKKFNDFVKQGVPPEALRRVFEVFFQKYGQTIEVKAVNSIARVPFQNDRYLGIADFNLPSSEKRFYLLDLKTGQVERHYVSHGSGLRPNLIPNQFVSPHTGKKPGYLIPQVFSNEINSGTTSLGIFITGRVYESTSFKGNAMKLFGFEPTNYNAYARSIVVHQANYASPEWMKNMASKYEQTKKLRDRPRLGRSLGCFAFDPQHGDAIIEKLKGGALIYSYVQGAEKLILESPEYQEVVTVGANDDEGEDTPEEIQQVDQDKHGGKASPAKANVKPTRTGVKLPKPIARSAKK